MVQAETAILGFDEARTQTGIVVCRCGDNDNYALSEKPALAWNQPWKELWWCTKFRKPHHNCSRPISYPSAIEEACKLVEASFEYVCDGSEAKIFRKRKEPLGNLLRCWGESGVGRERFEP